MLVSDVQQSDSVIYFIYIYIYIYTHVHTCILFHILFHYGLLHDIECSSLGYTVGPCRLSILYTVVYICQSQTPNLSLPHLTPQCSQQHYLQWPRHGSNLNVPQQMNGYKRCDTYIQWNITQL